MSRKVLMSYFLKIKSEEDFELMYHFIDDAIYKKLDELRYFVSDETYAWESIIVEKAERDAANELYWARAEGRAEGIAEGRAEGEAEGEAEGIAKSKTENTFMLLSSKFPDCPASFLEQVNSCTDIAWIDRVFKLALKCSCWEELKEAML